MTTLSRAVEAPSKLTLSVIERRLEARDTCEPGATNIYNCGTDIESNHCQEPKPGRCLISLPEENEVIQK